MSFSRNAAAGVTQVVVTGVCLFLLYRYLARVLGPSSIGLWSIVLSGANAMRLADLGISGSVVKFVATDMGAGRAGEARQSVAMALIIALPVVGAALFAIWWLAPTILDRVLHGGPASADALAIVPTVLLSAWIATGAGVLLGALDGIQRIDLRALIASSGAVVQLATTWSLVPAHGLWGIALGHLAQSVVTFVFAWITVRVKLGSVLFRGQAWNSGRLRTMLMYGGGLQLSAVAQMLFEPLMRVLLARYGTLALTGYYEMATRLVYQTRSVLVGGYQALIPHIALIHSRAGDAPVRDIYLASYRLLAGFAIPFFALLAAALPLISYIWLGRLEPQLLQMGIIAIAMWAANALIVPAYYVFLGLGQLRWITASQIATTVAGAVIAVPLGRTFGGYGVAIASGLAVFIGSGTVINGLHREQRIPLACMRPPLSRAGLVSVPIAVAVLCAALTLDLGDSGLGFATAGCLLAIAVVGYLLARDRANVSRQFAQLKQQDLT